MQDPRKPRPLRPKNLSILVMDTNNFTRGLISEILRNLDATNISSARTVAMAEGHLLDRQIDVIMLSWEKDDPMNGLKFVRELRRLPDDRIRRLPLVFITSGLTREFIIAARDAGVDEFLSKPISPAAMRQRLEMVIETPRPFVDCDVYLGPCRRRKDDPNYLGPWRRLTDEPTEKSLKRTSDDNAARLRAIVDNLGGFADQSKDQGVDAIRQMYRLLNEYAPLVARAGDEAIVRIWDSAIRYVEGVGMTNNYDLDVIRHHLQTLRRILEMPEAEYHHRGAVVQELERLVSKRVQGAQDNSRIDAA